MNRKILATFMALGMTLGVFSSVAFAADTTPATPDAWGMNFQLNGYVYWPDGVTMLNEPDLTFRMVIACNEDGDNLYYPEVPAEIAECVDDEGLNGYLSIDDTFIDFGYYAKDFQVGEPGNFNMNYKIWVYGSLITTTSAGDGWCTNLAGTTDVFTFPASGASASQDIRLPAAAEEATVTALNPVSPSNDNTPDFTYSIAGAPANVEIWYATVATGPYTSWGVDASVDGAWTPAVSIADGTYYFAATAPAETEPPTASEFGPYVITSGIAPVVANQLTTPATHNGNIASELVTITADITDGNPADTLSAEYRVDGGAWVAFAQTGVSPLAVSGVYNFPNGFTEGAHTVEIRGFDGGLYSTIVNANFAVDDITAPVGDFSSVPTDLFAGSAGNFFGGYGDFTTMNWNIANSYFWYTVNAGPTVYVPWTNSSFAWGSYTWILRASTPAFAEGDVIVYGGQITDTATPALTTVFTGGGYTVLAAPPAVQDPYPIYGYVSLYDDVAHLAGAGIVVTATWISSLTALPITATDTTNALGQFSIDLLNYTNTEYVELTANFGGIYNNNGYNYTTIDIVGFPGGRQQNVVCGVPYEVVYNPAIPLLTPVIAGVPFGGTYQILDRDGTLCQGYYTFADGPMNFWTFDPLFVNDVAHPLAFDGTGGAVADGTYTFTVTFFTPGVQFLNISEGGMAELNPYLTPWGDVQTLIGGVFVDIWYDDWENTTVFVQSGIFMWNLVVGWNQVCVPMDPNDDGGDLVFGAFDALREVNQDSTDALCAIAHRTGGNPSNYEVFDFGGLETDGNNFAMNYVEGYWIYATIPWIVTVNAQNISAWGVDNVITLTVGWNLLGFTHNYSVGGAMPGGWNVQPMANDFVDGTVDADLNTAVGAHVKIVATWWVQATQWYNSYVQTDTFPGMAGSIHDWTYNTNHAYGYFVWTDVADTITFDTEF